MINYPELDQLRQLNPVPRPPHNPDHAERLLHQLLAEPRTRTPRRSTHVRRRIGAVVIAAAVAIAAVVIGLTGPSGALSLVARAYAAVNVGDQVLHEVDISDDPGAPGFYFRVEGWLLLDGRARLIDISGDKRGRYRNVSETIITATGRGFARNCYCRSGQVRSFLDGRRVVGQRPPLVTGWVSEGGPFLSGGTLPGTFARWFRAAYRSHAIATDGTTMFGGKRAARFRSMTEGFGPTSTGGRMVFWRPGTPPPASARNRHGYPYATLIHWYVDPGTAQPVGFREWYCRSEKLTSCVGPATTTRIVTFQRLGRTPQSLAELTAPGAP
jgi:hypothetical protein